LCRRREGGGFGIEVAVCTVGIRLDCHGSHAEGELGSGVVYGGVVDVVVDVRTRLEVRSYL
jgi:hypothetical protein